MADASECSLLCNHEPTASRQQHWEHLNQFTFSVFVAHQGSQPTKIKYTKAVNVLRRPTILVFIELLRNGRGDVIQKESASTATPHTLI